MCLRGLALVLLLSALLAAQAVKEAQKPPPAEAAKPAAPAQAEPPHQDAVEQSLRILTKVYSTIEQEYADPVLADKEIYQGAIPGMLRRLDPYSVFFDAEQFHALQQQQQSKTEGFGTIVSVAPGRVVVLEVFVGSPAARAGIQPGDDILEVNGFAIARLSTDEIVELLGAARQQRARILVLRPNSNRVETIVATPAELTESSVDRAFLLGKGIGYLHVTGFEEKTAEEIRQALEKWGGELHGLVLDLRANHGGLVDAAVNSAGLFLPQGALVLTARGRSTQQKHFLVEKSDPIGQKVPLVVLVSEQTASAAEILAGALQDHGRARLVGLRTFGKGTMQTVYPLSDGAGLALATARYLTPSGRFIERTRTAQGEGGIDPDYVVEPFLYNEFQAFLESNALFLEFARKLRAGGRTFREDFEITPELIDEFRAFLSGMQIPVGQQIWSDNVSFIRANLKTEITTLYFGVARGDQVAAATDPQIQRAVEIVTTPAGQR